jgi:hypothetical protein
VLGVSLGPLPSVLQSPPTLTTLYRNHRFVVSAILRTRVIPREVILRGHIQNGVTEIIELAVLVKHAKRFTALAHSSAFLHTLAARGAIRDVREGTRVPSGGASPEDLRHAEIVRFGVRYQLASEFTSFVGVDEGTRIASLQQAWRERRAQRRRHNEKREEWASSAVLRSWGQWGVGVVARALALALGGAQVQPSRGRAMPSRYATSAISSSSSARSASPTSWRQPDVGHDDAQDGYWTEDSVSSVSTMSSLNSDSSVHVHRPTRRRWVSRRGAGRRAPPREPSPDINIVTLTPTLEPRPTPQTEDLRLIELQAFDGSFPAGAALMSVMGRDAAEEAAVAAQLGIEEDVWATVLAVEYLERTLQDQLELLDGLLIKVMEFIERKVGRTRFEELRAHANGLKRNMI